MLNRLSSKSIIFRGAAELIKLIKKVPRATKSLVVSTSFIVVALGVGGDVTTRVDGDGDSDVERKNETVQYYNSIGTVF